MASLLPKGVQQKSCLVFLAAVMITACNNQESPDITPKAGSQFLVDNVIFNCPDDDRLAPPPPAYTFRNASEIAPGPTDPTAEEASGRWVRNMYTAGQEDLTDDTALAFSKVSSTNDQTGSMSVTIPFTSTSTEKLELQEITLFFGNQDPKPRDLRGCSVDAQVMLNRAQDCRFEAQVDVYDDGFQSEPPEATTLVQGQWTDLTWDSAQALEINTSSVAQVCYSSCSQRMP